MEEVILLFAILLCILLLFLLYQTRQRLRKINRGLEEVCKGNLLYRFRVPPSSNEIEVLTQHLNNLLNLFQTTTEQVTHLEEERKKMITNISHDLRTPLTSLLGYADAIRSDSSLSSKEREKYIDIIVKKGHQLASLLQYFFELSKIEANDLPMHFTKVNLSEKVREALASFYQEFTKVNIIPAFQLPDDDMYVWADSQSIERILNNLLSNAIRYGAEGKSVGIELREETDHVWVCVWNYGTGIDEKDIPYIFKRLYTGEASRNPTFSGNGLGLTIVKKLIEKQHGEIFVNSRLGEKTTFSFYLPKNS